MTSERNTQLLLSITLRYKDKNVEEKMFSDFSRVYMQEKR